MAKKEEATAKFTELETLISQMSQTKNIDYTNCDNVMRGMNYIFEATKKDIYNAGYDGKKTRSDTTNFLKKVESYYQTFTQILNNIRSKMQKVTKDIRFITFDVKLDAEDIMPTVSANEEASFLEVSGETKEEIQNKVKELFIKNCKSYIEKILKIVNDAIKKYSDFKETLKKQQKRTIFRTNHISRFCNDGAITKLNAALACFLKLKQALKNIVG